MHILLVDDDDFLRDMYATKFKEGGHTVAVAKDGEQALVAVKQEKFDIVLFDMVMPGISGIELIKRIKSLGSDAPKCVALSNQSEEADIKKAKTAGVDGYIVKAEMIPSEVVAKVESMVT